MSTEIPKPKKSFYSCFVKRILDIFLSSFAILCLSPLLLIVSIIELIIHGRPIFYKQRRPGKDEKVFLMYKFRSMNNKKDENGKLLSGEQRVTKFGYFLRKTSIDELPGLFNVFKGDMSVIGPRPLLEIYLPLYPKRYAMRHVVRPGLAIERITPSESKTWTWRDQFENDIFYIENISFWTDLKMIFAVIKAVFQGSEYRARDTREPFNGTNFDN
jgi:lipopolysaccharide/colanic/teichoic acid biosynthesis glycosyltransferase